MRLEELISIIKNTELRQISVGEDDELVFSLLNMALIDVYAKFDILQEEQIIKVKRGKTRYRLQDNSQRVLQVYVRNLKDNPLNGNDGYREVPINNIKEDDSVFFPQPYIMHVPNPDEGKEYLVIQTVTPPYVTAENYKTLDFIIPPQLTEPIANYCGYRGYLSVNGGEEEESNSHYIRYMRSCNDVWKRGLVHYTIETNTRLHEKGFV